jgi:branched-chain amino acid transport system ATP-binding protein
VSRLEAHGVRVHFEGVKALDGVDFTLEQGELLGLIGPNGAGKTTLVNVLSGFQRPTSGSVSLLGKDVTGWSPSRLARQGLGRTFQNLRLFGGLTVFENAELGALGVGLGRTDARERAWEVLDSLGLAERHGLPARALPQGEERKLGIARALATRPRFLLLDEPAAGLDEEESDRLLETIAGIRKQLGCGVLVIEHDMRLIMQLCKRIQVLDYGKTIAVGTPVEVRSNEAVVRAYLGAAGEAA